MMTIKNVLLKQNYLLLVFIILNLLTICFMPISHDEAYYGLYAKNLAWGFFDHPPMVGLMIKIGQYLTDHVFGFRVVFFILQSLILFFANQKNSGILVLLLSSLFIHSGFLAIPDSLLLIFTFLYFWSLEDYIKSSGIVKIKYSLFLSLAIGLGLLSKYHLFLVLIFTFIASPKLLKKKETYLVIILSLCLFFPHVKWQFDHDFVTWKFHLFGRQNAVQGVENFYGLIGSYFALGGLLISFPIFYFISKHKPTCSYEKILKFSFLGQAIFFLLLSFRNSIEGNWLLTMVIPGFILITRIYNQNQIIEKWKNYFVINFAIIFCLRLMFLIPIRSYPIPRLAELFQWEDLSSQIREICGEKPIYANSYQVAAKLTYYLNREINALHLFGRKSHYTILEESKKFAHPTKEFCFVSNYKIPKSKRIDTVFEGRLYIDENYISPKTRKKRSGW